MTKTPRKEKIEELIFPIDADNNACKHIKQAMLSLAHYIKAEIVPEEVDLEKYKGNFGKGINSARYILIRKFKEMGI